MNGYKEICETLRLANSWQFAQGYVEAMLKAADVIEQLVKERDAAVEDLTFSYKHGLSCFACKHDFAVDAAEYCIDCKFNSNFEWRGVQEDIHDG